MSTLSALNSPMFASSLFHLSLSIARSIVTMNKQMWKVFHCYQIVTHCKNISGTLQEHGVNIAQCAFLRAVSDEHFASATRVPTHCTLQEHWVNTSTNICTADPCPCRHAQDTPNHLIFHTNTIYANITGIICPNKVWRTQSLEPPFQINILAP